MSWDIHYILFRPSWNQFLAGVGIDNADRHLGRPSFGEGLEAYLAYLRRSAAALALHGEGEARLTIDLLELMEDPGPDPPILQALAGLPGIDARVAHLPWAPIQPLIQQELSRPPHCHRSPNSLHEWALYHLLLECQQPWLAILDVDTLVTRPGLLEELEARFQQEPHLCAAAFMEGEGPGFQPGRRPRMHTVALFFQVDRLRQRFDLTGERDHWLDFEARLAEVRDPGVRAAYRDSGRMDSLSILTERLLQEPGPSPLLDLNRFCPGFFEAGGLVLGCRSFIHGKYAEKADYDELKHHLAREPEHLKAFFRTFNAVLDR